MDQYELGSPVPLTLVVTFGDPPEPAQPDTVKVTVKAPDGTEATHDAALLDPQVLGVYGWTEEPDAAGVWLARWDVQGQGAGVTEWAFVVVPKFSALPYEATVEGTRARVLEVARPAGTAPAGGAARPARIGDVRVAEWLIEGGARVRRKLRLLDSLGDTESDAVRLEYRAAARALVETYAAALLWDATYPQAAKDGQRYGAVLFERFEKGLAELAGDLAIEHEAYTAGKAVTDEDPGDLTGVYGGGGASARFPVADPRIGRYKPW